MPYDPSKHHRRSIRLPGYDYASPGAYFVTICVRGGECLLGEVVDGGMRLNDWGQIAAESWEWLNVQYPYVSLDAWVIMPNHMHGIIVLQDQDVPGAIGRGGAGRGGSGKGGSGKGGSGKGGSRKGGSAKGGSRKGGSGKGGSRTAPTDATPAKRKPLGRLVGAFKTVSTRRINQLRGTPGIPFWQRNYWEHIIRDERSLNRIREYIQSNPARWMEDQLHPDAPSNAFNRWQPSEL